MGCSCLVLSGCFSKIQNSNGFRFLFSLFAKVQRINGPKIIVFKDDDTANDEAIQRYRDACLHNNIVGSYATVADRITRNTIDVSKLVQFEQEGFTVMCHCNEHASYWRSGNYNVQSQREDMAKVINTLRKNGFINYMYWQTPFGSYSDDILHLCTVHSSKAI